MKYWSKIICAIMLCAVSPVMADTYTNNQTYTNACDTSVLGVTSGNRSATMLYEANEYECAAGTYLPADATECTTCPAGYACAGGTYTYNANDDQGKTQCTGTTYSEAGSASCTTCPDANTYKRTTFPAEYYDATVTVTYVEGSGDRTSVSQCQTVSCMRNNAGELCDRTKYNPTTEKYDIVQGKRLWSTVNAGYYLTNRSGCGVYAYYHEALECPAGSYCPGKSSVACNSSNAATVHTTNFGLESCPEGYTSSATGAKTITECYKSCTTSNVSHSSTVTGNDYYGDGRDTCAAATCDTGYSVQSGTDWATTISTAIGNIGGVGGASINSSGTFSESGENGQAYYGISDNNSFAVDYGTRGILTGHGYCSSEKGFKDTVNNNDSTYNNPTTVSSLPNETGRYCYCNIDGYKASGGGMQSISSGWVYRGDFSQYPTCDGYCAGNCVAGFKDGDTVNLNFRSAAFNAVYPSYATCAANTITINWGDGNGGIQETNTCTYGGDITTPTTAPTKRGHVFLGWRF